MRVRYPIAVGFAVAAACAPTALAQGQSPIEFQYLVHPDGGGGLIASVVPAGSGPVQWSSCPNGGGACQPLATGPDGDRVLNAGDAPAGTVFEATVGAGGQVYARRSSPYLGRVRWTEPPGLAGPVRVNSLVRPVPASWQGGWGDEASYTQLQVCRSATAKRCYVIADADYWNRCPSGGAVIDGFYEGWYLRAIDRRGARSRPLPAIAYGFAEAIRPATPAPAVASTPPLRILPAAGPPQRRCGMSRDRVTAALRTRVGLRGGKPTVGTIACLPHCRYTVAIQRTGWRVRLTRRLMLGKRPIVLPPRLYAKLRGTRPRMTVAIDGRQAASRRVRVPLG